MTSHHTNYFAGIDLEYISSRVSGIDRHQDPVKLQLKIAEAIFPGDKFLPYIDGPFMLISISSRIGNIPIPGPNPISIRGHQIEIQNTHPESITSAKRLEYALGLLGHHYTIVNITPEVDDGKELMKYAGEALPMAELEYRLVTEPDFHTAPLIVAHHLHEDGLNPIEEIRRGRFVFIDGHRRTVESIDDETCLSEAERLIDAYREHGIRYKLARVAPEFELEKLNHTHHLRGATLFRGTNLF
jgi:hypothetical protein